MSYADGEKLRVTRSEKFPPGTYLWELSESLTDQSGVWLREGEVTGAASWWQKRATGKPCGQKRKPAVIFFGARLLINVPPTGVKRGPRRSCHCFLVSFHPIIIQSVIRELPTGTGTITSGTRLQKTLQ